MNNNAYKELGTVLFCIILFLAVVFYLFKLNKVASFFFLGAAIIGIRLLLSPLIAKHEIKQHNKKIAGVYYLEYIDSFFWNEEERMRLSSSKMILSDDGVFRIQNYPKDSADSIGLWTWCSDGNYFGICFSRMDKSSLINFRSEVPYTEIRISEQQNFNDRIVLRFKKPE
jgi:hypothetical protein